MSAHSSTLPSRIGDYEISGLLGEGGMGIVYRATDPRFDRPVAIKVLHSNYGRDPGAVERFRVEAVIQAKLNHPHIVRVLDFVAEGGAMAIVMEYVEGIALDEVLERAGGALAVDRVVRLLDHVLLAVGHAHENGLVHRDLKPSNIYVQTVSGVEYAKVMDFGIAKVLGSHKAQTATSAKLGTIAYMSPEQVRSAKSVDARSDIYSLGMVLYEMLAGRLPFDGDSEYQLMRTIVELPPPELPLGAGSAQLRAVVARALQKEASRRFQSCAEMRLALGGTSLTDALGSAPPSVDIPSVVSLPTVPGTTARADVQSRRRRVLVGCTVALTLAGGGLVLRQAATKEGERREFTSALQQELAAARAERERMPAPAAAGQDYTSLPTSPLPVDLTEAVQASHADRWAEIAKKGVVARRIDLDADGVPEWFIDYAISLDGQSDQSFEVLTRRAGQWVPLLKMDGEVARLGLARPGQLADVLVSPRRYSSETKLMVWNGRSYAPAQATRATPLPSPGSEGAWLFPTSSRDLITDAELSSLTVDQLWRARNEIYARHEFAFTTSRGRDLARQLGLAPGRLDTAEALERMTATERENLDHILAEEMRRRRSDR